MFFSKLFQRSKSFIGNDSNHNTVIQNSTIEKPVFIGGSNTEIISTLGQLGHYDKVQEAIALQLDAAKKIHPLYPEFTATFDSKLKKLVSTAETEDAFKNHPKVIKGTYRVEYSKYPYMDRSETPWAYAYRTQTKVEMDTTSYQEFLGDMEDPFPVLTFSDGMKTIIGAPEFPEAVEAYLISGDVKVAIMLRRLPCMEFGKTILGNVSTGHGFDIRVIRNEDDDSTKVNFSKSDGVDLKTQLLREKLLMNMAATRKLRIEINGAELMSGNFSEQDLTSVLFTSAPVLYKYLESLIVVERKTGCKFDTYIGDISADEYRMAIIAALSFEERWHFSRQAFDDTTRADYNHIPDSIFEEHAGDQIVYEKQEVLFSLHGIDFIADKYVAIYQKVRVSNIGAVKRAIKQKRKDIKVIIKPIDGESAFNKYVRYEGIKFKEGDPLLGTVN